MRPSQCYRFGWLWPSLSNLGVLYLLICSFLQNFRWIEMAPYFKILGSWRALLFHLNIFTFNIESESESHSVVSDSLWPHGLYSPWNSPGQNTGVGSLSLLQGIFPTQGSNPDLLHCRWILNQLSHQGSPSQVHPQNTKPSGPKEFGKVTWSPSLPVMKLPPATPFLGVPPAIYDSILSIVVLIGLAICLRYEG